MKTHYTFNYMDRFIQKDGNPEKIYITVSINKIRILLTKDFCYLYMVYCEQCHHPHHHYIIVIYISTLVLDCQKKKLCKIFRYHVIFFYIHTNMSWTVREIVIKELCTQICNFVWINWRVSSASFYIYLHYIHEYESISS